MCDLCISHTFTLEILSRMIWEQKRVWWFRNNNVLPSQFCRYRCSRTRAIRLDNGTEINLLSVCVCVCGLVGSFLLSLCPLPFWRQLSSRENFFYQIKINVITQIQYCLSSTKPCNLLYSLINGIVDCVVIAFKLLKR